jgi:hypothetical protein
VKCEFVVKRKRRSCDGLMGELQVVMGVALYTLLSFWVMATSTSLSVGPRRDLLPQSSPSRRPPEPLAPRVAVTYPDDVVRDAKVRHSLGNARPCHQVGKAAEPGACCIRFRRWSSSFQVSSRRGCQSIAIITSLIFT